MLVLQPSRRSLPTRVLFPQDHREAGLRWLEEEGHQHRVVERWARARSRGGLEQIEVERCTASIAALLEVTRRPGVELLVMPWTCASWLTQVCTDAAVPVLVAHRPREHEHVLAASNLELPERPVIRAAMRLSEWLRSALTVVHNRPAFAAQLAALGLAGTVTAVPDDERDARDQERTLRAELARLGSVSRVTITRRLDPAAGILEVASEADADLIVVGAPRSHSKFLAERVAERLCTLSERSVLVVPT